MKKHILFALAFLILRHPVYGQASPISGDQDLLQGVWQQACANRAVRTEDFEGSKVTLTESFYGDDNCQTNLMDFMNDGTFELPAPGQMDFTFTFVRVKLGHEVMVADFNRRAVCGFQDWKLNEEKDISGLLCEMFVVGSPQKTPTAGDMRFGIYRIDHDHLYFGQLTRDENASTPLRRPTNYDPRFYTRVPHAQNRSLLGL